MSIQGLLEFILSKKLEFEATISKFKKGIVSAETIRGNTVFMIRYKL